MKFKYMMNLAVLTLAALLLASGCSRNSDAKLIDLSETAQKILTNISFSDEMIEIKYPVVGDFYNISENDLSDCKVYKSSSGSTAEEFALFETKDLETVNKIISAVNERINDLKFGFEGYVPIEMKKLNNAVVISEGKYVFMGIADDDVKIRNLLEQATN